MSRESDQGASGRPWENLILAMIAVGGYPLQRALMLREVLRKRGLLDPRNLAAWTVDRVAVELKNAGYDRGRLTVLYADRLVSLGKHAKSDHSVSERILMEGTGQGTPNR